MSNVNSLYIHIPFCRKICYYCDFPKRILRNQDTNRYSNSLIKELEYRLPKNHLLKTIYIGGGTPSCIPIDELESILKYINKNYSLKEIIEFTIELNPEDVRVELLILLKKYNVNRISLGVQSINNTTLQKSGRNHLFLDIQRSVKLVGEYFENFSCDFMYNLPDQSISDIEKIFSFIIEHKIKHFSFYSLIIEEKTKFYIDGYKNLTETEESKIYQKIQTFAKFNNYHNYEISNFSKVDYESVHNLVYWKNEQYVGVGLGASGYFCNQRYTNTNSLNKYFKCIQDNDLENISTSEEQTRYDMIINELILGLRTSTGIMVNEDKFPCAMFNELYFEFYEFNNQGYVRIKSEYFFITNTILIELIEYIDEGINKNEKFFL